MKRVAALWLENWSIDRILLAEPKLASLRERTVVASNLSALRTTARKEQVLQCDAPKNSGWRPGARWARGNDYDSTLPTKFDVEKQIAALPIHQRPPMRMLGRSSEAVDQPFRTKLSDETNAPMREKSWRTEVAEHPFRGSGVPRVRYPGEGPRPDKHLRRGSNDPHSAPPDVAAFFDTGRTMAGLVGRICRDGLSPAHCHIDGVALVTTHKIDSRVKVAAVSSAAKAQGIACGMALTQVRASVPDIVVRDADPAGDADDLHRLAVLIARRWAPIVAKSDTDTLLIDLTGVAHLHGGEMRMARRLLRLLARAGFTARVGIADTAGAAWALARYVEERLTLCPPGRHAEALSSLPARALRLPEPTIALLKRLGVETVRDVAALPRAPFARRFGADAVRCLDQAMGHVSEPFDPVVPSETIQVVQRFAEPIGSAEVIEHWLKKLVPQLTLALAQAGLGARRIIFVADRVDGQPQSIRVGFARPSRDPAHINRLICRRIGEIDPGFGIDALHLHVCRAEPLEAQPFDHKLEDSTPDIGSLIDILANRSVSTWREVPMESDVPERSIGRVSALYIPRLEQRAMRRGDVRELDQRAIVHPWDSRWPRPVRMLHRPERLDHVVAELPDQPPRRFTWRGKRHVVAHGDGPERVVGEWWKSSAERNAVRDYFLIEDEAGHRFWLFRRGDGELAITGDLSWYLHGRFG